MNNELFTITTCAINILKAQMPISIIPEMLIPLWIPPLWKLRPIFLHFMDRRRRSRFCYCRNKETQQNPIQEIHHYQHKNQINLLIYGEKPIFVQGLIVL